MDKKKYYMDLPKDLSGSISKNRFRLELLWEVSKIIDEHKTKNEYTVIFDFKCDIELHKENELNFYQIKTKKSGNYNSNNLCKRNKNEKNSILGKLYALYSSNYNIKLAIVCNHQLKINNKEIDFSEQCFGELDQNILKDIKKKLCTELNLKTICLDNVFYVFDNMDLLNPEDAIRGKLVKSFTEIKGEEPQNPNALYNLVVSSVREKASYEFDLDTYEDVVKNKGITRSEFDKILNAHKKESKNGINETLEYINNLSLYKRRRYNIALGNILEIQQSKSLQSIKLKIYNYIEKHSNTLDDIEYYLKETSRLFNHKFDMEFTDDMKSVLYIMIYYIYATGGTL